MTQELVQGLSRKYPGKIFSGINFTEIRMVSDNTTKVDCPVSNSEKKEILQKLNSLTNIKAEQNFTRNFRLDNPHQSKGSGHWEIQKNSVKGKTTVAQVHAPDWVQEVLNVIGDQNLQTKYEKLLISKLKESLESGSTQITKAYVTLSDLKTLFLK